MKTRFTYKEFSLVIGILVAVIVVSTFWMGNGQKTKQSQGSIVLPSISSQASTTVIFKKVKSLKSFTSEAVSLELPSNQSNLY
jgi:hypothetical protein